MIIKGDEFCIDIFFHFGDIFVVHLAMVWGMILAEGGEWRVVLEQLRNAGMSWRSITFGNKLQIGEGAKKQTGHKYYLNNDKILLYVSFGFIILCLVCERKRLGKCGPDTVSFIVITRRLRGGLQKSTR